MNISINIYPFPFLRGELHLSSVLNAFHSTLIKVIYFMFRRFKNFFRHNIVPNFIFKIEPAIFILLFLIGRVVVASI